MSQARKLVSNKHFRYVVDMATCTVEECQYEYKPKSNLDIHATPLIAHLETKYLKLSKKKRKKAQGIKYNFLFCIVITKNKQCDC